MGKVVHNAKDRSSATTASAFQKECIETIKKINEFKLIAEANAVSSIYKNPDLIRETSLKLDDITNNAWRVYYSIANDLINIEQKNTLDELTISMYLSKHSKLSAKYDEYGGFDKIESAIEFIKEENFDSYVSEIKKWNAVMKLAKIGFPVGDNDLSMINASLRPSGASYRDRLLAGEINKNPSPLIDDLLKDNRGFLIFQEDVIAFLQKICGLSGSEADNVRRAIGRKQMDRLQKALPDILDGYCKMSPQSRDIAEKEAKTFLQIIEDSSNYMFGFNHSTGYSMIGYMCALCRYYYPEEFIASYLNCANNTDDIIMGTELAKIKHVAINNIQFGKSGPEYTVDKSNHALYKGIASIKFCNAIIADEMLDLAHNNSYKDFTQLLGDINSKTSVNSRQLTILTGLNFFSEFGNNKYLMNVTNIYDKLATAKIISKKKLEELGLTEFLMKKYAGRETASQYRDLDNEGLIFELASRLENKSMSVVEQVKFEKEYLQYVVYSNPRVNHSFYIVTDYKTFKEVRKPYCTLHNIKTGEDIKTRVTSVKTFENNPFGEYSILRVDRFTKKHKKKCINGTWQETEELEDILDNYEVIRNE